MEAENRKMVNSMHPFKKNFGGTAAVWILGTLGSLSAPGALAGESPAVFSEFVGQGEQHYKIEKWRTNNFYSSDTYAEIQWGPLKLVWKTRLGHTEAGYAGNWCAYARNNRNNAREIKNYNKQFGAGSFEKLLSGCDEGQARFEELSRKVTSLAKSPLEMSIRRVSDDASTWVLEFAVRNPIFSEYLISKKNVLRFRAPLAWVACDGRLLSDAQTTQENWSRPLEEVVASFQKLLPQDFMKCTFRIHPEKLVVSDDITPVGTLLPKFEMHENYLDPLFTFQNDGPFYMTVSSLDADRKSLFVFSRVRESDPALREHAIQASRRFVSLIKSHGRFLLELASAGELSQTERELAVKNALQIKKPEILAQIEAMNQGFGELNMVEKLSVSTSVREAYDYVRIMEVKAAKLLDAESRLNLDLTMQKRF